jgi:hypothetical protein
MEEAEPTIAIQLLQLHDSQVHGLASKPEKPRLPELTMTSNAVENTDWEQFIVKFEQYKTSADVTKDSSRHLLECLSPEVYSVLFSYYE